MQTQYLGEIGQDDGGGGGLLGGGASLLGLEGDEQDTYMCNLCGKSGFRYVLLLFPRLLCPFR